MANTVNYEVINNKNGEAVKPLFPYGVGIDTHRDFIQICVTLHQNDDMVQYEQTSSTQWEDLKKACEWTKTVIIEKSLPVIIPSPLRYTIESTSTYHLPIIKAFGGMPSVVNPVLAGATRRKTDALDARLLSYQSMVGLWNTSYIVPPEIQEYRLLIKAYKDHQHFASTISNRINNYILRFGHTLGALGSIRDIENRSLIEDMCAMDWEYKPFYSEMKTGRRICPDGLPYETQLQILDMYEQIDFHTKKMKEYEKKAYDYACDIRWETNDGLIGGYKLIKNMMSVPGVGKLSTLIWLAEIVTPHRFKTAEHIAAYCGCDPSLKISAGKVTSQTRRKGNALLHHTLTTAAGSCINHHSEPFGQWGYAIKQRHAKGGYKKASGAVARRIAISLYYIQKYNEPFSYDKYNFYKLSVPEMALADMQMSKRVTTLLSNWGVKTSTELTEKFLTSELYKINGLGKKAMQEINEWIQSNKIYSSKVLSEN